MKRVIYPGIFILILVTSACSVQQVKTPKHIILMISDGGGFNQFYSASYYRHGQIGKEVYDKFPVKLACTTYMLNQNRKEQTTEQGYDPVRMWTDFNYMNQKNDYKAYTCSAAAMTAIVTGQMTTRGRISTDPKGNKLKTIAELCKDLNMRVGTVTTVPVSHATPACVMAHSDSRNQYGMLFEQMVKHQDVTIGAGHPFFDDNGRKITRPSFRYVRDTELWQEVIAGKYGTFIDAAKQFKAIASRINVPAKLVGIIPAASTTHAKRTPASDFNKDGKIETDAEKPTWDARREPAPFCSPRNENLPGLEISTAAALAVLGQRGADGFFLMVESGAVDWMGHNGSLSRTIEEQISFNRAVELVVGWIEKSGNGSNWDNTLLIITADHECGKLWGPGSSTPACFKPVVNNGKGKMPGGKFYSNPRGGNHGHTNALVPIYARGHGCKYLETLIRGKDPKAAEFWGKQAGRYIHLVDIYSTLVNALEK